MHQFVRQAVAFLNAYWPEVKDEAEFIFSVAWDRIKYADMHAKGIDLVFKYEEGFDLDFDIGLYFYEQLCKFCEDPKNKEWTKYERSQPEMMTAIKRKQELREKVDVNFDGRVSFLEYLLYQYKDVANPADFCKRSMAGGDEHPEIRKARLALEEATKAIKAFEAEKARLEEGAKLPGVKGLKFKNMLAQVSCCLSTRASCFVGISFNLVSTFFLSFFFVNFFFCFALSIRSCTRRRSGRRSTKRSSPPKLLFELRRRNTVVPAAAAAAALQARRLARRKVQFGMSTVVVF